MKPKKGFRKKGDRKMKDEEERKNVVMREKWSWRQARTN